MLIFNVTIIMNMEDMTTISISNDVRDELLKHAAELQLKLGRRVDLEEAVRHLLSLRRPRNPELLKEACRPMSGVREAIKELLEERKRDEERLWRKIGARR